MSGGSVVWRWAILATLVVVTLLSQRVFLTLPIGQSRPAILELLPIGMAMLAALVTIRWRGRNLLLFARRDFLLIWGPYLGLSVLFPVLGVVSGQYPIHTLAAIQVPAYAISSVVLGAELIRIDPRGISGWRWALFLAVLVQGIYAVLQQLVIGNLLPQAWDWVLNWDISTQRAFGDSVIVGRSAGFYINPNILGAASGVALLIGICAVRPRLSYAIVGATFAALLLSQSRGASAALIAALGFLLVLAVRRHQAPRRDQLIPYAGVVVAVVAGWLVLVVTGAPAGTLVGRFGSGISLQDPNVVGRIEFWEAGLRLLGSHPFGTLGPPELLLGTAVDSDWVRALLEGGPIFIAALALALGGGALIRGDDGPERRLVRGLSVFVAVAAITQLPLQYPAAYLYWAVVGAAVATPMRTGSLGKTIAGHPLEDGSTPRLQPVPEGREGSRAAARIAGPP